MATPEIGPGVRVEFYNGTEYEPFVHGSKWLCLGVGPISPGATYTNGGTCTLCGSPIPITARVLGVEFPMPVTVSDGPHAGKRAYWWPCACQFRPIDDGDIFDRKAETMPNLDLVPSNGEII